MASSRNHTISFLSDYGTKDEFVGVVKSVIHSLAPESKVIDISHEIKAHDIRAGGLALARAAQYLDLGVVLAVVDPGVGGARKGVAIEVNGGDYVFVGPDNGLLPPAVAMLGESTRAVELNNLQFHLPALSSTFAGRDIFAPVAAHLTLGIPLDELGNLIPVHSLQPGLLPVGGVNAEVASAEVLWEDRFGNLQLNLSPEDIQSFGETYMLRFGETSRRVTKVETFESIPSSEIGIIVDSCGLLSISMYGRSAAEELRLHEGQQIELRPLEEEHKNVTPVTLRRER
ncbi:MAG: SAM-dependent chlorinase/fluorinase [Acidimicrobiales bacterium]|nr:SAM-dependent chlorinase/fluorinase [Acidimicrobiales bacterium]